MNSRNSLILILVALTGCDTQSRWYGVYEPISRACEGETLVIEKAEISWGDDCKNVKITPIDVNNEHYMFKVEERKGCAYSKHTISIKPEPSRITESGYGVRMYEEYDKNHAGGSYCYFKRK